MTNWCTTHRLPLSSIWSWPLAKIARAPNGDRLDNSRAVFKAEIHHILSRKVGQVSNYDLPHMSKTTQHFGDHGGLLF
jgi:hypothetical protein